MNCFLMIGSATHADYSKNRLPCSAGILPALQRESRLSSLWAVCPWHSRQDDGAAILEIALAPNPNRLGVLVLTWYRLITEKNGL